LPEAQRRSSAGQRDGEIGLAAGVTPAEYAKTDRREICLTLARTGVTIFIH
jgi:hypothetical protein